VVIFATRVRRLALAVDVVASGAARFVRAGEVVDRRSPVGADVFHEPWIARDQKPPAGELPKVRLRGTRRHEALGCDGLRSSEAAAHLLRPVAGVVCHAQHYDQLASVLQE
jgi:hypothetical protein